MPAETTVPDATPPFRSLRHLRHRVALLLLTFSVVLLPNLLSHAALLLGE